MSKKYNNEKKETTKEKNKYEKIKDNTINSLKEVECFLWNWKKACKGIYLYKGLKK